MVRILLFCLFASTASTVCAQSIGVSAAGGLPGEQRIIPPAPATAGLGTYGSLPVDLNSGAVSLSVPLATVQCRSLTLPVSLAYRTTGVRVEEVASWVGLSWSLNAGGLITRTIRGQADETSNTGYFEAYERWRTADSLDHYAPTITTRANKKRLDQEVVNGNIDTEPDSYSITVAGQSATFYVDVHHRVHLNPNWEWVITGDPRSAWEVVLPDGTKYTFAEAESTAIANGSAAEQLSLSAWHQTAVESADGKDRIVLEYEATVKGASQTVAVNRATQVKLYAIPHSGDPASSAYPAADPPFSDGNTGVVVNYRTKYLKRIRTATTVLTFVSDATRPDLKAGVDPAGRRLTAVVLTDTRHPSTARRVDFTYNPSASRLVLDAVQHAGQPAYRFFYKALGELPGRLSNAQDHWGYYNGFANSSLIPAPPADIAQNRVLNLLANANRATNPTVMQVGVLTAVQYPTGGRTYFEYEANRVLEDRPGKDDSVTTFTAAASGISGDASPPLLDPVSQAVYDQKFLPNRNQFLGEPSVGATIFTLPLGASDVRISPPFSFEGPAMAHQFYYELWKLDDANPSAAAYLSGTQLYPSPRGGNFNTVSLAAGTYLMFAATSEKDDGASLEIKMHVKTRARFQNRAVGGLRIRRMTDYGLLGDSVSRTYDYSRYDSTYQSRVSTGVLFFEPQYFRRTPSNGIVASAADASTMSYAQEGYHIGYDQVRVTRRGTNAGTTVYNYKNDVNPNTRNLVLNETVLDATGHTVKQAETTYSHEPGNVFHLARVSRYEYVVVPCVQSGCGEFYIVVGENYETDATDYRCYPPAVAVVAREHLFPTAVSSSTPAAGVHESTTTYDYPPLPSGQRFTLPRSVRQVVSGGDTRTTYTRYARDYAATPTGDAPTTGVANLVSHHVLTAVVETQQWRTRGTDSVLVGGALTHYRDLHPVRTWQLVAPAPVAPAAFSNSRVQNGQFLQDARYVEALSYDLFDRWGNVREEHERAARVSYLWDNTGNQLLAKTSQAHYAQTGYTSFEPAAPGRWSYDTAAVATQGVTGRWSFKMGSSAVKLDSVPPGTYTLSLWATSAPQVHLNGVPVATPPVAAESAVLFHCYRYQLPLSAALTTVSISGPGGERLDEIRFYPTGTLMQSYTHEPLDGLLSNTDPSGRAISYEYDDSGRLVRTRDEQGRILSQQQYHYAGQ